MKTMTLLTLALSLLAPRHFLFKATPKPCDDFVLGYTACLSVKVNERLLLYPDWTAKPLSALRHIYIQVPGRTLHLDFLTYTLEPDGTQRWFAVVAGRLPLQPAIITYDPTSGWFMVLAVTPLHTYRLDRTQDQYDIVEFDYK